MCASVIVKTASDPVQDYMSRIMAVEAAFEFEKFRECKRQAGIVCARVCVCAVCCGLHLIFFPSVSPLVCLFHRARCSRLQLVLFVISADEEIVFLSGVLAHSINVSFAESFLFKRLYVVLFLCAFCFSFFLLAVCHSWLFFKAVSSVSCVRRTRQRVFPSNGCTCVVCPPNH